MTAVKGPAWVLAGFAVLGTAYDLWKGKIPNVLMMTGCLCGTVSFALTDRIAGLMQSAAGLLLPVVLLWPCFRLRILGAGDIKMLAMAGSFLGPAGIWRCMSMSFLAGGILAAALILSRKNLKRRFAVLWDYLLNGLRSGEWTVYTGREDGSSLMHFSLPVLCGILWVILKDGYGF